MKSYIVDLVSHHVVATVLLVLFVIWLFSGGKNEDIVMRRGARRVIGWVVVLLFMVGAVEVAVGRKSPVDLAFPFLAKVEHFMQSVRAGGANAQGAYQSCMKAAKNAYERQVCIQRSGPEDAHGIMSSILDHFLPRSVKCEVVTCTNAGAASAPAGAPPPK